jgi:hypothetical protein
VIDRVKDLAIDSDFKLDVFVRRKDCEVIGGNARPDQDGARENTDKE